METKYEPIQKKERVIIVDVLRGLAIFGILMVNIHLMYRPMLNTIMKTDIESSALNAGLESLTRFLFEGKFYILFSFLFGYSFWIFMSKSIENGKSIVPFFSSSFIFFITVWNCTRNTVMGWRHISVLCLVWIFVIII